MTPEHLFRQALKNHSLSITRTRLAVFNALLGEETVSMTQLHNKVSGRLDRATLYRTVKLFESLGIIQRLQLGWKHVFELSDSYNTHHHHINCVICGTITPIREDVALESAVHTLARDYGFTNTTHQFEIRGQCRTCSKKAGL